MPYKDVVRRRVNATKRRRVYRDRYGSSYMVDYRIARKLRAIEFLGGKCVDCGCAYHYSVYDFHHTGEKDVSIWHLLRNNSWEAIEQELGKCVLLCANCHRLRHAKEHRKGGYNVMD